VSFDAGRGRFAPGSDGEKAVKIKIQQRVDHDFANRRIFERSRIIEAQGVTRRTVRERDSEGLEKSEARLERLDEDLEYLKDVESANEAVGKALQKQIVAYVQEAVEANKVRDAASSLNLTPSTRLVFISRWRGWSLLRF
jgi:hypothetical protein